jgi:malate dehydrogenase (oxaloacetate-decarboxylating)
MEIGKQALKAHKRLKGKIGVTLKDGLDSQAKLSTYYTPGVAAVSRVTAKGRKQARDYTWIKNSVAVVSDGSAVLGLGDIGPYGALPVMEGKAMLFKHFAGIDAVPVVLDVHSEDEIVKTVEAIAPSFGAVNLEDIAAPKCFSIEERLKKSLSIPVMHDDQHGTAVVVLAGLINALKVVDKKISDCKIVIVGAGAAGTAVAKLLYIYARPDVLLVDSRGIISGSRKDLNPAKKETLKYTNLSDVSGELNNALADADVFIGVSQPNLLNASLIKRMAASPVIFAMANPDPEILPDAAKKAGAAVVATGRSDFPNQVNNALAFPGIFRGALDHGVRKITDKHKVAAAEAMAALVSKPTADKILPTVLDKRLVPAIAKKIA